VIAVLRAGIPGCDSLPGGVFVRLITKMSTRIKFWLSRVAVATVIPLLLLAMIELVLGALGVGTPTGATRPCVANGRAAACDNFFFTRAFFPPGMLRTPRPYAIATQKQPGTYRIVVLGESAAYGDPDPAYAFSRYLEVMLRDRFPGARFEVINTGITAINSHVIVPIAEDLAKHEPDLFIVYAGNNEVVGPFGPGTVFTSSAMSRPMIRASIFARTTRLGQLIDSALRPKQTQRQEWRGMEMFLSRQIRGDSPAMERVYGNFADNLRDIVRVGQQAGARVLLSTVATNLRDCGPFGSLHRDGMTAEQLQSWSDIISQGTVAEIAGDYARAAQRYKAALDVDSQYAETEFRLARALWMSGDLTPARQHFIKAQDLDTLRFRADSRINAAIKSVAEQSGVEVADAADGLARQSEGGVAGSNFFFEHVHLSPRGNYAVAASLFQHVVKLLPTEVRRSERSGEPASEALCNRLLALTPYDRSRLAAEMAQRMQRPPFTNQINHREMLAAAIAGASVPGNSDADTVAQYQWALQQHPEDGLLHLNFGMFLGHINRAAALEELRRSRPYQDTPFVAPDGTIIR
jgi:tetratricopeptide (TPR) repeat protein